MKQYTNKDQTAKLIELGFPKPKFSFPIEDNEHPDYVDEDGIPWSFVESYSMGELIELLPKRVGDAQIDFFAGVGKWFVRYEDRHEVPPITVKQWQSRELIDALFCACVTLKEEGVI